MISSKINNINSLYRNIGVRQIEGNQLHLKMNHIEDELHFLENELN